MNYIKKFYPKYFLDTNDCLDILRSNFYGHAVEACPHQQLLHFLTQNGGFWNHEKPCSEHVSMIRNSYNHDIAYHIS